MASEKENFSDLSSFVRNKIRKIFESAEQQYGHQKLIEKCKKLHKKCGDDSEELFLNEFLEALKYVLVYQEKLAVENILSFVAKFVTLSFVASTENDLSDSTVDESIPFVHGVLKFLFRTHGAASAEARLRCMQLLSKILSGMPENSLISDDIWKKLKETVLCRLQDKNLSVRAQAVLTARMLQDPKNSNCEIIKALLFHFNDPSPAVRRGIVSSVALNKITIGHVLARTRDVNDNVRRNAYLIFSKIKALSLTITYRITILERGLQDRSEMVRKCVEQIVVVNWLENFNKNILKFLEALDVVNCSDVAMKTVEAILKTQPIEDVLKQLPISEETRLIPKEKMTPEAVLFWRCLADYFVKQGNEEALESILPDLTVLCDYIVGFYRLDEKEQTNVSVTQEEQWTEVKEKEILIHLLQLIKVFDLSDEMGRCKLKELIIDMLISSRIQNNQIKTLVELLVTVIPGRDAFIQELTEVISEIRQPLRTVVTQMPHRDKMERDLKISDLKLSLNDLREREYKAASNKNYAEAQKLKEEIERAESELKNFQEQLTTLTQEVSEEKNDPITLCKCLTILTEIIRCSQVRVLTPILLNLKENFLNQCMASRDLLTQSLAIEATAQYCILDKELAKETLIRFVLMISEDGNNEINIPTLKGIFDIIQTHGLEAMEQLNQNGDEEPNKKRTRNRTLMMENPSFHGDSPDYDELNESFSDIKCLKVLSALLNCQANDSLKMIAYEGLCKLLLSGVVYSTSILSQLILKGFSPIQECESEDFIRQTFMVFFPIFAANTPRSQEMIESAFIPTLKVISEAPLGSVNADINPKSVATFLIDHTKPDINKFTAKTLHVHNNFALSLCHEVYRDIQKPNDSSYFIPVYLRALSQLDISIESESFLQQLQTLIDKIEKISNEPATLRLLGNFKKKLIEKCRLNALSSVENTLATTRSSRTSKCSSKPEESRLSHTSETLTVSVAERRSKRLESCLSIMNETSESENNDSSSSSPVQKECDLRVIVPESSEESDTSQ